MSKSIEIFHHNKSFSPHYVLEMSLVCKNCGTAKGRWQAASDGPTSFDFILTTCEYCGCFRFAATLYAKFYEKQNEKNVEKHTSRFDKEIQADKASKERMEGPRMIKKVEGERVDVDGVTLCGECGLGFDCVCATEPDEVKL